MSGDDDRASRLRPAVNRGDIVVSLDGRMVGLVLVVDDSGWQTPAWELHVDAVVDDAPEGVSIWDPRAVTVENTDANRERLSRFGISRA